MGGGGGRLMHVELTIFSFHEAFTEIEISMARISLT